MHNPDDAYKAMLRKDNLDRIKNKIVVMSGKGGVGKSTVAVNLAYGLLLQGKKVGILDVDLHGPSIATMTGVANTRLQGNEEGRAIPAEVVSNLHVVSIASLTDDQNAALIWRGPMKMGIIKQFLEDIVWPELDYLIIDCPPGTGDEPLSVIQLIDNITGAVIVSTPQEVSLADVRKSIDFANKLDLKVLGIIENMSGFICPKCGEKFDIFKSGGVEKLAKESGIELLGTIPIEKDIVEACDSGKAFIYHFSQSAAGKIFEEIVAKILK
ncbi:MAG: Mrp/NBP35 family ATP-binding protein [Spirochaetales bacterium]|nr:Mrp/NBP35 family ATP-binding protein [Spirochaetales bacterium]